MKTILAFILGLAIGSYGLVRTVNWLAFTAAPWIAHSIDALAGGIQAHDAILAPGLYGPDITNCRRDPNNPNLLICDAR
jgi:hypothetical protein